MMAPAFKPDDDLTFKTVVDLRAKLFKALSTNAEAVFRLDLSNVAHCDSAGLALLIEARKLCTQKNKKLEIVGISPKTQSLAEFCGVKTILELNVE